MLVGMMVVGLGGVRLLGQCGVCGWMVGRLAYGSVAGVDVCHCRVLGTFVSDCWDQVVS